MKKTIRYLKPYRSTVAWGLIIKFIGSIAELFLPLILEYIIDDIVPTKNMTKIIIMGFAMLGFSLVALFGNIVANRLAVKSAANMTHDLRYDLFAKTCCLQCGQVDEVTSPSLISRLTSDTYYVNQMVARTLRLGVRAPILLIGGIIMTFTLDTTLALVLLCLVPFVIGAIVILTKKSVPCYFDVQKGNDDMVRSMQENISGVRVVKALSKGDYEEDKFNKVSERLASKEFAANRIMSLTNPLATLILNIGLVGVIAVGAYISADSGKILAFMSYFTIILNAMLGLSKIFVVLSRGVASADRVEKVLVLDERQRVDNFPDGDEGYKVQFDKVCFSYNGRENNLEDVSFALKEGQTLGIIGATGSGKSTIINLMMRFYDADEGGVYIDGKDVRSIDPGKLRQKFGVAFQNDFLMSATVKDNVDFLRGIDGGKLQRAETCAVADEFIDGLEGKDNYRLTQNGTNLSGGQKQRLLIARALAGSPEIIVLDDSSSALDYATDATLRKNLNDEYGGCTKVIIAQRVSSIMNADLILVMDDGRVIGRGTHDCLLKTCDEYAQIYSVQMGATRV